jgi:hypothetical protein
MAQFGRRGSWPSDCRSYFFRLTYFCPIDWRRAIAQQLLNSGEDDLPLVIDKNLFIIGVQLTAGPAAAGAAKRVRQPGGIRDRLSSASTCALRTPIRPSPDRSFFGAAELLARWDRPARAVEVLAAGASCIVVEIIESDPHFTSESEQRCAQQPERDHKENADNLFVPNPHEGAGKG